MRSLSGFGSTVSGIWLLVYLNYPSRVLRCLGRREPLAHDSFPNGFPAAARAKAVNERNSIYCSFGVRRGGGSGRGSGSGRGRGSAGSASNSPQ